MRFLEKNLEDIIYNTDSSTLYNRGLPIWGKKYRQIRIGEYGIADIITFDRHEKNITIYELKKETVDHNTIAQVIRYMRGVQRYLDYRNRLTDFTISGVVIGNSLNKNSSLHYLTEFMDLDIYTYDYYVDGISFEDHSCYKLIKEGFDNGK